MSSHSCFPLAALLIITIAVPVLGQQNEWLVQWNGQDRPGPVNLAFTTGWPVDAAGFEQHDPNNCYLSPGPHYAEGADVDSGGFLSIQNEYGTCENIGPQVVGSGACDLYGDLLHHVTSPCGMRYQIGPRTVLNWWGSYNSELIGYHNPVDVTSLYATGCTAEVSFYVVATPQSDWTKLIEMEVYPRHVNPWNGGGGPSTNWDNHYAKIALQHFVYPSPRQNEWHLVAVSDNTFDLGNVQDMMNRWVTVRLSVCVMGKPQMWAWVDGQIKHEGGWDAVNGGESNGSSAHGYCRFGYDSTDGDVRIGTMAFTNQGVFSPLPRGQCVDFPDYQKAYFRPLAPVPKTRANPEICDDAQDNDGDGLVDCDDPDCFQSDACGNLLVNGSFERQISACEMRGIDCAAGAGPEPEPTGWQSSGDSTVHLHGDQWIPEPRSTDGPTRASVASGAGAAEVWQTVAVVPDSAVTLHADVAPGHSASAVTAEHFVEILDGETPGSPPIQSFITTSGQPHFQHVTLSGTCTSGFVTVRWGYRTLGGWGSVATHVDNLYLQGTPRGLCNDPFADADGDRDVDMDDFANWQRCFTGGGGVATSDCECFDVFGAGGVPDGAIDNFDFQFFQLCSSAAGVPAEQSCDDALVAPVRIASAVSRRTHGAANYDVDIRAGNAVEPRNGGPQKIVIGFNDYMQAVDGSVDAGDEVVVSAGNITGLEFDCDVLTINLANVPDMTCVGVTLSGLALESDLTDLMPPTTLRVLALVGDVDASHLVTQADVDAVHAAYPSGGSTPVTASNFRMDLDASDVIDYIDELIANYHKGNSGSCP